MGSNPILAATGAPLLHRSRYAAPMAELTTLHLTAVVEEEPAPAAPQPPLVTSFDVRVPA